MGSTRAVSRLSLRSAVDGLQATAALEKFSPLTGAGVLVVDLDATGAVGPGALEHAAERLRELPCPGIGVRIGAQREAALPFEKRLDVVATSEQQLEAVLESVSRRPIASLALVQLLRHSEHLDVHEALIAESLVYSMLQSGPEFATWLAERKPAREAEQAAEPAVISSRDGDRLKLELNRPQRHNAYSAEMRDALAAGLEIAVADETISEVVLSGRGPSFSAGGDLAEFGTLPDPATAHVIRSTRSAARLLAHVADRVRAQVHGACIGAGVELAAFAARVVAREDAFFQLPEISMGLVPGAGGTASIPGRIGRQRTAYLALSGERIGSHTALEWGLIDEVVA